MLQVNSEAEFRCLICMSWGISDLTVQAAFCFFSGLSYPHDPERSIEEAHSGGLLAAVERKGLPGILLQVLEGLHWKVLRDTHLPSR